MKGVLTGVAAVAVAATATMAAERLAIDGSTGVLPLATALATAYQERRPGVIVELGKGLGTKARIAALVEGKIDVALASHGLVVEELTRQGLAVHEVARVAVVFGVNAGVPTRTLTQRQVCDVYAGKVASWTQLGGPDIGIVPRTRPQTEVDSEVVRGKVPCLRELKLAPTVQEMPKSGDMARALAETPGALGMTTMTVVEQSRGRIRALALDGIEPTAGNVKTGTYTLTRESFFVTRASPPASVAGFLQFVRSPDGQKVISANGAVPVP